VGRGGAGMGRPGGLQMDGGEVAACSDPALGESGLDAVAICGLRQTDDVNKPAYGAVGQDEGWKFKAGDGSQEAVVACGGGTAEGKDFFNAGELDAAEGAGDVGKAVVVAGFGVVKPSTFRQPALVAEAAEAGGVGRIVGQDCAALAGGYLLVGIEAEDGEMAEAADAARIRRLAEFCADGLAGVFNEEKFVAGREGLECIDVSGDAEGVYEEDGAGAGGEDALDGFGVEIEGDGVNFSEYGRGADLQYRVGHRDESEGRNDDFVAFTDVECKQGEVQAGGAGTDGYGLRDGVVGGEGGFKGGELRAQAEVRRAETSGDGVDFELGDVGGG